MKRSWWWGIKLSTLLVVGLFLYRMVNALFVPGNLYYTCHVLLVLGLLAWIGLIGLLAMGDNSLEVGPSARIREMLALAGLSIIILGAFVLAGQGRLLSGGEPWSVFPFLQSRNVFALSFSAALIYLFPIWSLHILLNFRLPQRSPALLPLAAMLAGIGLVLLYRLGPDIAIKRNAVGFTYLFWNQYLSLAVSLFAFIMALFFFTPQRIERLTRKRYIYALGCVLLICVTAVIGKEMYGRKLSIDLGIMNFQTVELVKLMALFFMVSYFRFEGGFLEQGRNILGLPRGRYLLPYLIMWVLVLLPIFFQKDLGPTALLFALFLILFYAGTGSGISVLSGTVIMVLAGVASYKLGYPSMVRTRVDMWFEPFLYSQNMAESLWAVSSGGWFGVGAGSGMPFKIPVVWSDFNFSALAEEWGMIGAGAVLCCFGMLTLVCLKSAGRCREPYLQLLGTGIGALWFLQTMVIVGGNLALLPLTGITLPFISFGGSSLIMNFVALALILQISALSSQVDAPTKSRAL